jgi:hypothetical protein
LYQFGAVDGMLDKGNRFLHHKSHMTWLGLEPGPPQWEVRD